MTETKNGFILVGLKLPYKTTNRNHQADTDCGLLWQQFEQNKIAECISEKLSDEIFAVYFDYEKDETTPFSYFIGCRIAPNYATPENMDRLEIPAQQYEKFTAKGQMTGCITEVWKSIWNSGIKRQFGFDFEVYDERSRDWNKAEVDVYVSVTK